jgi:hypothetical protein
MAQYSDLQYRAFVQEGDVPQLQAPVPQHPIATAEGYSAKPEGHTAFHGYSFRMLKGQTDKAGRKTIWLTGDDKRFAFVAVE